MSAEFRQRHMRVIESNENDVSSQIRMNHGRELEVVDAALDQILKGLDAFAYEKQRADSRLEDAQMFLAVRSFNSLHIARQLLERGLLSIARVYRPVVARVIEPPCGPVDGLLSPLGLRVNHLLSVEQGPVG